MVIISMGASIDGFISDRSGDFSWGVPSDELFAFHTEEVGKLRTVVCGRRLYETMLCWETDPAMRHDAASDAFADVWSALPKVVFSRTLDRVEGNARLATGSIAEELAAAEGPVELGGPTLAAQAIDLVDELRIFRSPVVLGGGTPLLPPVTERLDFELAETRHFAPGTVYERYVRVRD